MKTCSCGADLPPRNRTGLCAACRRVVYERGRRSYHQARYVELKRLMDRRCAKCRRQLSPDGAHVHCHICAALASPGVMAAIGRAQAACRRKVAA